VDYLLRIKFFFLILIGLLFSISSAFAVIDTTSMMVAVDVVGDCTISASPLMFGLYNPGVCEATKSTTRLKVLCTLNTPYYVTLGQGAGYSATTRLRRMSGPDHSSIKYILSQNPTHTINWGNVIGIDAKFGVGNGLRQILVVYGEIPPKQNVVIGSYRDVVNVNIIF
jgi:spore coat protein U domain-containing protein, fimbrial subunit CupE1/2/3/6